MLDYMIPALRFEEELESEPSNLMTLSTLRSLLLCCKCLYEHRLSFKNSLLLERDVIKWLFPFAEKPLSASSLSGFSSVALLSISKEIKVPLSLLVEMKVTAMV